MSAIAERQKNSVFFGSTPAPFISALRFCYGVVSHNKNNKTNKKALGTRVRSHVRAFLKAWQFISRFLPSLQKPQAPPSERRQGPALALRASGKFGSVVRGLQASADTVATCLQIFGARAPCQFVHFCFCGVGGACVRQLCRSKRVPSSRAERRGEVSPLRPPHCHITAHKRHRRTKQQRADSPRVVFVAL